MAYRSSSSSSGGGSGGSNRGGKLRPTERVLNNVTAISAALRSMSSSGSGSGGSGGGNRSGFIAPTARVGNGLPELVNLQAMTVALLTRLVDVTSRNGQSVDPTTRASR